MLFLFFILPCFIVSYSPVHTRATYEYVVVVLMLLYEQMPVGMYVYNNAQEEKRQGDRMKAMPDDSIRNV